jgi:hypothetical protein
MIPGGVQGGSGEILDPVAKVDQGLLLVGDGFSLQAGRQSF